MRPMHKLLLLLTPTLLAVACGAPRIDVAPRYGQVELEGDLAIGSGGASLEQAGLGDEEDALGLQADFKWGSPHLSISTQSSEHSGSGTLDAGLGLGGVTIPVGASVDSDLDLGLHQGILTFDLVPTDTLELGLGFGVAAVDFDARFRSATETVETDQFLAVPVVAVRGVVRVWRLEVGALVSGMQADIDDESIDVLDLDARVLLRFPGGSGIAGHLMLGYRWQELSLEYEDSNEDIELDTDFRGPYLGLVLSI